MGQMTRVSASLPAEFTPCLVVTADDDYPVLLATYDGERWVGGVFLADVPGVIAWAYVRDAREMLLEHIPNSEYRPGGP